MTKLVEARLGEAGLGAARQGLARHGGGFPMRLLRWSPYSPRQWKKKLREIEKAKAGPVHIYTKEEIAKYIARRAMRGSAWQGLAWHGWAGQAWQCAAWYGGARQGHFSLGCKATIQPQ